MSDVRIQLLETVETMLTQGADADAFVEAGFALLLVPEDEGGFGGDWGDCAALLSRVGYMCPSLDIAHIITKGSTGDAFLDGALATIALVSGALDRCADLAIDHANTRVQFGKPLGKQQAVQQSLSLLAEESAAVAVAVQASARAREKGDAQFEIACAKLRTNRAIGTVTAIAHQVHGAIGFTADHPLHRYTRALYQWRSAFGNDSYWAEIIGGIAAEWGGQGLWKNITERADA